MKKLSAINFLIYITVCLFFLNSCTIDSDVSNTSESTYASKNVTSTVDAVLKKLNYKGIVYITYDDKVIYNRGLGKANKEFGTEITCNTPFYIASNSKQFTAGAIMILQQSGDLSVDDTLNKYFPDYQYGNKITIHQLLCMRSGIKDYMAYTDESGNHIGMISSMLDYEVLENVDSKKNRNSIEKWIFEQPLEFKPNEKFQYSNSNYMLLAEIVEKVSGEPYEDFITNKIFKPLKMDSAGFMDTYENYYSIGAEANKTEPGMEYLNYSGVSFGAGDIVASAKDIELWLGEFKNKKILSEESVAFMTANYSENSDKMQYGYGFMLDNDENIYHTGYITSYSSMFLFSPDNKYNFIIMSNSPNGDIEIIGKRICREVLEILSVK